MQYDHFQNSGGKTDPHKIDTTLAHIGGRDIADYLSLSRSQSLEFKHKQQYGVAEHDGGNCFPSFLISSKKDTNDSTSMSTSYELHRTKISKDIRSGRKVGRGRCHGVAQALVQG